MTNEINKPTPGAIENEVASLGAEQIVQGVINQLSEKWQNFFNLHWNDLKYKPAAVNHHHNFAGGLLRHISEMLRFGMPLAEMAGIEKESFIKAVLLHDFAKLKNYEISEAGVITYEKTPYPVEFWTMNQLAKAGIDLKDDEINALVMAEGGWSEYEGIQAGRLAALLHIADLWSAAIIKPQQTMDCPKCGRPMVKRSGPRGDFYGCSAYPNCSSIIDISQARPEIKENMSNYWEIMGRIIGPDPRIASETSGV